MLKAVYGTVGVQWPQSSTMSEYFGMLGLKGRTRCPVPLHLDSQCVVLMGRRPASQRSSGNALYGGMWRQLDAGGSVVDSFRKVKAHQNLQAMADSEDKSH